MRSTSWSAPLPLGPQVPSPSFDEQHARLLIGLFYRSPWGRQNSCSIKFGMLPWPPKSPLAGNDAQVGTKEPQPRRVAKRWRRSLRRCRPRLVRLEHGRQHDGCPQQNGHAVEYHGHRGPLEDAPARARAHPLAGQRRPLPRGRACQGVREKEPHVFVKHVCVEVKAPKYWQRRRAYQW